MAGIIKDSGNRREFASGAVRDIAEGKGRCDLLPLEEIGKYLCSCTLRDDGGTYAVSRILQELDQYIHHDRKPIRICDCISIFCNIRNWTTIEAIFEVSKHYEEGAKKYAERNWEKGIPAHCFIDSGVRHLLKWYDGMVDEPHDRAFLWNMFGLLWTMNNKSECNDLPEITSKEKEKTDEENV